MDAPLLLLLLLAHYCTLCSTTANQLAPDKRATACCSNTRRIPPQPIIAAP